jgi:uncharacterized protein YhhL (DUF1145 family)
MSEAQAKVARGVVIIVWVLLAVSFFMPPSTLRTVGQVLFWLMLVGHAVECAVYWPTLRATGKPLAGQVLQTLLFGYIHYQAIKSGAASR